jgi:MSHA pilin protein MshA
VYSDRQGFTLVEVVVVITVLSILAAVAVPRYISLQRQTADGAAMAVAGAITSGTAMNFGRHAAGGNSGVQVTDGLACAALPSLTIEGLDAGLSMAGTALAGCAGPGTVSTSCTVQHAQGTTGGFRVLAVCTN